MKTTFEEYFKQLIKYEDGIVTDSLSPDNIQKLAKSHMLITDIETWLEVIKERKEVDLFKIALEEYQFSILSIVHGYYRNAFKGIRLVLELFMQGILLSSNELLLREWLDNRTDTRWSQIRDYENGVFSKRFARAFCKPLEDISPDYLLLIDTIYRECSECVHGNIPKNIEIPETFSINQETINNWIQKTDSLSLVINFAFALRYIETIGASGIRVE